MNSSGSDTECHPDAIPIAYFITFSCYGIRLHGDPDGSVHHRDNIPGTPHLPENPRWMHHEIKSLNEAPYSLDEHRRRVVLQTIKEICIFRGWELLGAHVRSTHVHFVVIADCVPEKVLNTVKCYASRNLNRDGFDCKGRKRWTRHGSTRFLWKEESVEQAVQYVIREQGEPMEIYEKK